MAKETGNPNSIIETPFGFLGIWNSEKGLERLSLMPENSEAKEPNNLVAAQAGKELIRFIDDAGYKFQISLLEQGTPFQKSVWKLLRKIPLGQTVFYIDIAKKLNTSPRAIGAACRTNPIPVITPCHRVVAKNDLGGYMGHVDGPPIVMKKWLIEHEVRS